MTSEKRRDANQDEEPADLLDQFVTMEPIRFEPPAAEDGRPVSRGRMHVRSGGYDHFVHLPVSGAAEHGEERHREQLDALRAGFILVLPHDDDEPEKPGYGNPAEEPRVAADSENLTFEISGFETTDATAPSYHVAYA